ncbi:MAG TPA: ABC transporter ATP-binding protein [Candidatus Paceibacterota bacterium]|nr:ABC transporter ATP-binding protein [Candidatus Paceibacterota bacterium]
MIKVENLFKVFKTGEQEIKAVNNVSFEVPEGQFLMVTGKSGSGKSTLLYQLGLLDQPTSGHIHIDGIDTDELTESQRTQMRLSALGYIFQDYAILPTLTALENVMVPLLMLGERGEEAERKALHALKRLEMSDRKNNLPSQLSGGQQQRVSIARAIAHGPKILFADEPTANLDTETSMNVLQAFLDLNKEGQTIVMVTHEADYSAMGHRIITLADGKLVEDKIQHRK